jgi:peroxiredoxin
MGLAYGAADGADAAYARRISYLIGPDGVILEAWGKVDTKSHAGDVLAKL